MLRSDHCRNRLSAISGTFKFLPSFFFITALFIVPPLYQDRITTGFYQTDLYLICITGCLSWVAVSFVSNLRFTRLTIAVTFGCIYVCILCLSTSFPDDNSINATLTLLSCIGIICYLHAFIITRYGWILQLLVVLSIIVQVLIGLRQVYIGYGDAWPIQGQMANSGAFANYLSATIPWLLAIVAAPAGNTRFIRIGAAILMTAAIVLVLFTQARAAFVGIIVGSVYVAFFLSNKKWRRPRPSIILICIIFIPLIAFALYRLKPASAQGRLTIYKVSLNIIQDHPLTGVGVNRFAAVYNNYQSEYFKTRNQPVATQLLASDILEAYNIITQVLTEYGFIGLLLLIWILYEVAKVYIGGRSDYSSTWQCTGSAGSLLSVLIAGFFSNPFHVTPVIVLVLYHVSIVISPKTAPHCIPLRKYYWSVFVVPMCMIVAYWLIQKYQAEKQWAAAATAARMNDFASARQLYEMANPALAYNGDYLFNYGAEACVAGEYLTAIEQLGKAKQYSSQSSIRIFLGDAYAATRQYQRAEDNYLAAIYTTPSHIYPKYKLVQLYKKWGKTELARQWATQTLQYPVKVTSALSASLLQALQEDIKNILP